RFSAPSWSSGPQRPQFDSSFDQRWRSSLVNLAGVSDCASTGPNWNAPPSRNAMVNGTNAKRLIVMSPDGLRCCRTCPDLLCAIYPPAATERQHSEPEMQ